MSSGHFNPWIIDLDGRAVCVNDMQTEYSRDEPIRVRIEGHVVGPYTHKLDDNFAIKKVHFNDPATVVLWADGTKTVVKCSEEDIYDPQTGLLMCIAKKAFGNNGKFNDILRKWVPEEKEAVDPLRVFANYLNATLVRTMPDIYKEDDNA